MHAPAQYLGSQLSHAVVLDGRADTAAGDVSHLAHLSKLDQLTLANNPAIRQPDLIQ